MLRILAFVALSVSAYISLTYLALIVRVLLGVFSDGGGILASFVYTVTEPILIPIRRRLDRIEMLQNVPLDLSVLVAMILFMLITMLLPSVI